MLWYNYFHPLLVLIDTFFNLVQIKPVCTVLPTSHWGLLAVFQELMSRKTDFDCLWLTNELPMQWSIIIDHCYKKAEKDWWEVFQGIRRHPFASFLFRVFTLLHPFILPSSSASASLSVFATYLFSFNSKESQYHQHQ